MTQQNLKDADMPPSQIGLWVTIGYLSFLAAITESRWDTLPKLPLNEVGDFLAGAFGPIAVFWLILGFFQQGRELNLQIAELRRSVEHQEVVADASRRQAEASTQLLMLEIAQRKDDEIGAQPAFRSGETELTAKDRHLDCTVELTNLGAPCFDVRFTSEQIRAVYPITRARLGTGEKVALHWTLPASPGSEQYPASDLTITYRDAHGRRGTANIRVAYGLAKRKAKVDPRYIRGAINENAPGP